MADKFMGIVSQMTFLLFLASVAVLEYILHKEPGRRTQTTETKRNDFKNVSPHELPPRSGLASLAEAVDRHGNGETVGTLDDQAARKPGNG